MSEFWIKVIIIVAAVTVCYLVQFIPNQQEKQLVESSMEQMIEEEVKSI